MPYYDGLTSGGYDGLTAPVYDGLTVGSTYSMGETEFSDSIETSSQARLNPESENSESQELGCRNVIYYRSVSETSVSEENRIGAPPNPYDPDVNPIDPGIGIHPGIDLGPITNIVASESSHSAEGYSVYKNGILVGTDPCHVVTL